MKLLNYKKRPLFDIESYELIYGKPEVILSRSDFAEYQRWMSDLCYQMKFVFLAADMGLGKTAVCLDAIRRWKRAGIASCVLVIAPLRVAEQTWPEEFAKWDFARDITYSVVTGPKEQRIWALSRKADVYVLNRENIVWLYQYLECEADGDKIKFDALIYDEASRLKGAKKKTKPVARKDGSISRPNLSAFGTLQRIRHNFNRVVALSGTPAPNGIIDLWGPMYILDGGQRLGKSMSAFTERWFSYNPYKRKYTPHEFAKKEVMDRIKDCFFSLRSEDYLELPYLKTVDHIVGLKPKVREKYERLERKMLLEEYDVMAVNRGVLANKLLQLANGSLYREDEETVRVHDAKLEILESIVSESGGKPMLVAYSFQFDKEVILKKFPYARVYGDSQDDMRDWNSGKIKMLIAHPSSVGHGLNFQYGSNIAVWYGLTWSLELYMQFIKRLHRRGQKMETVFMHRILIKDTFDERMVEVLSNKGAEQDDITEAVRVMLENVK